MKKCTSCNVEYEDSMQFCMSCGSRLEIAGITCISCSEELKPGMKFCPFCGSSQQEPPEKNIEKKPSGQESHGISLGDRNVIAGDIISGKEDYNISGNVTFIKHSDESGAVKKCASCGKKIKITDSFECPSCQSDVCQVHYHEDTRDCEICNPKKRMQIENFSSSAEYIRQADIAREDGEYGDAFRYYNKALALNPDSAEAYNGLGFVNDIRGDYDDAFRCVRKALELKPLFPEAYYTLGWIYLDLEQYEEAFNSYTKALDMKPNYPAAQNGLGKYHEKMGDLDKAVKSFQKALDLRPEYPSALYNMGNVCFTRGNYEKAIEYYNKVVDIKPNHTEALVNKSLSLFNLNAYEEAHKIASKVLEIKDRKSVV